MQAAENEFIGEFRGKNKSRNHRWSRPLCWLVARIKLTKFLAFKIPKDDSKASSQL